MGYGDELMASGMARGAAARGKRIAFGDGRRIVWSPQAHEIFLNNPNVARPGAERCSDIEWIPHYRGHRLYAKKGVGRWIWDFDFKIVPGEMFFSPNEIVDAKRWPRGSILIEPSVKPTAVNKQWPRRNYEVVARELIKRGFRVAQFQRSGHPIATGVQLLPVRTFRQALAFLSRASLFIGPEGGLHHGAAALGVSAVVIFGGFISPRSTGYDGHVNLFSGGEPCGTIGRQCPHCIAAMAAIEPLTVIDAALDELCKQQPGAAQLRIG